MLATMTVREDKTPAQNNNVYGTDNDDDDDDDDERINMIIRLRTKIFV